MAETHHVAAGTCLLYTITLEGGTTDVVVEQRGFETTWVSGFKWAEDNTFPGLSKRLPPQHQGIQLTSYVPTDFSTAPVLSTRAGQRTNTFSTCCAQDVRPPLS